MIAAALETIVKELNTLWPANMGTSAVLLERLVDQDGKIVVPKGHICCTLVSMEEERIVKKAPPPISGAVASLPPPEVLLNLYVLVAVNPREEAGGYATALRQLSRIVALFQGRAVLTPQNTPSMPPALRQISMEIYPLSIENQNHLWGGLGAKYLPSVLYKLRLVAIQDEEAGGFASLVQTLNIEQGGPR